MTANETTNSFGVPRRAVGRLDNAEVLFSIASPARVFDPEAPVTTVCRVPDGRFATFETSRAGSVLIGAEISITDAAALAMSVLDGEELIARHPATLHALATAFLGLLAAAKLKAEAVNRSGAGDHVVVQFPSARGAG